MSKQTLYTGEAPFGKVEVSNGSFEPYKSVLRADEIERMKKNPKQRYFWRRYSMSKEKP